MSTSSQQSRPHDRALLRRALALVRFAGYFAVELVKANLRVAADVLTRAHRATPGIVAVPLEASSRWEVTLLANLVSLTPGTLSLEVRARGGAEAPAGTAAHRAARNVLYVHAMFAADPEAVRRDIQHGLEPRLLAILRPPAPAREDG